MAARRFLALAVALSLTGATTGCGADDADRGTAPESSTSSASVTPPGPTATPIGDPAAVLRAAIARLKADGGGAFVQSTLESSRSAVPVRDLQGRFTYSPQAMEAMSTLTDPVSGDAQVAMVRNLAGTAYLQLPSWSAPVDRCWLRLDPGTAPSTTITPGVDVDATGPLPPAVQLLEGAVGTAFADPVTISVTISGTVPLYYVAEMAPAALKPQLAALTPSTPVAASFAVAAGRLTEVAIQGPGLAEALQHALDEDTLAAVADLDFLISFTPAEAPPIAAPPTPQQLTEADLRANRCPVG